MYHYKATIVRVVDGDTIDAEVDLGFNVRHTMRLRLTDINTPERGKPGYEEAKTFVQQWAEEIGYAVEMLTLRDRKEKFGRYLARVWAEGKRDCSLSINEQLLAAGLGELYTGTKRN